MPQPTLGTFSQRVYDGMEPMQWDEATQGWPLAIYVGAHGDVLYQEIEDYASDSDDGEHVGWSMFLDIDRCPDKGLPWLAQLVGVNLPGGLTAAQQRTMIKALQNWQRGTRQAMRAAAQAFLTGTQTVAFQERDTSAYKLSIVTLTSETANSTLVLNALNSQKPAGIVLKYQVLDGQTWQMLKNTGQTWAQVKTNYLTWNIVRTTKPT